MTDQSPVGSQRRAAENTGPTVTLGYWGLRFKHALASITDSLQDMATQSVMGFMLRRPLGPPPDATRTFGDYFNTPKYQAETFMAHVERCYDAWPDAEIAGTPEYISKHLAAAGFPGALIKRWGSTWSEFMVYFPIGTHTVTSGGKIIGSGWVIGDGTIIGAQGISPAELNTIREVIRRNKSGRFKCAGIVFQISGWVIGDGTIIGSGFTIGGTTVRTGA